MSGLAAISDHVSHKGPTRPNNKQKWSPTTTAGASPQKPASSRQRRCFNVVLFLFLAAWMACRACCLFPSSLHHEYHHHPWPLQAGLGPRRPADSATIPNQVHFVKLLQNPGSQEELSFHFTEFLSVYAAWHHWRPRALYLHTNAVEATVAGARDGLAGKWTKLLLQIPNVTVLRVQAPSEAGNGVKITSLEHKTEFVAVEAVREMGGVFMGFDVYALRDVRRFRRGSKTFVTRAWEDDAIAHDFFMSSKGSPALSQWADMLAQTYAAGSLSPSDVVLGGPWTDSLHSGPSPSSSIEIMDSSAFVSDKQNMSTSVELFRARDTHHAPRPRSHRPTGRHDHEYHHHYHGSAGIDWSRTYLLQVGRPHEAKWTGASLDFVAPRHLLERRSEFARVMYPVTRALQKKGLIRLIPE
ncbi:hypothetical protein EsDP_00004511 [Epichloe bromicola]|uniref:Glycosyl transferase n=1 Tax=Epichloe bromicola TaxID=79588 RepID=A0ABQ0CRX4_9HYPO